MIACVITKNLMYGLIYKATNKINGKCYIGQTKNSNFRKRKVQHRTHSKRESHKGMIFYRAINKYGFDNFDWSIMCECYTREITDIAEKAFILLYQERKLSYNIAKGGYGGDNTKGHPREAEIRKKQSENGKKKKLTDEQKRICSINAKLAWQNGFREKMSTYWKSEEHISRSIRIGKQNGFYGKRHTKEILVKIQETRKKNAKPCWLKGKQMSEQHKKNLSKAISGRKYSEERKKEISERQKRNYALGKHKIPNNFGRKCSPETKEKLRQTSLKYQKECREKLYPGNLLIRDM